MLKVFKEQQKNNKTISLFLITLTSSLHRVQLLRGVCGERRVQQGHPRNTSGSFQVRSCTKID
jgi:hypothetical protein